MKNIAVHSIPPDNKNVNPVYSFKQIDKGKPLNLYEEVFIRIKSFISDNRLRPGDKLPTEKELAVALGVGRSPVREALKSLQMLGVLDSKPKEGIVLREFNFDPIIKNLEYGLIINNHHLVELLDLRTTLENAYLEQAVEHVTFNQLKNLRDIVDKMNAKATAGSSMLEEDMAFHLELYSNVDNRILRSLVEVFWKVFLQMQLRSGISWDPDPSSTAEMHQKILEAFARHETESCRELLIQHYGLKDRILAAL